MLHANFHLTDGIPKEPQEAAIPYFVGKTSSSVTSFCTELMTKSTY